MTIAICLKVNDGVVLAADSASTLMEAAPSGEFEVRSVFNNANKVFNLRKGFPVGAITWGLGAIGSESTSTLIKDLRKRLAGKDPEHRDWEISIDSYTVEEIAKRLRQFIFDERYLPLYGSLREKPPVGFIVAGYSASSRMAEEYEIFANSQGEVEGPNRLRDPEACGVTWRGEADTIHRLIFGYGMALGDVLTSQLGVNPKQVPTVLSVVRSDLQLSMIENAMPIQDTIDLAEFLVDVTARVSRFTPGASTVGGPIEISAITRHEGYKWIRRKYYFSRDLNPEAENG